MAPWFAGAAGEGGCKVKKLCAACEARANELAEAFVARYGADLRDINGQLEMRRDGRWVLQSEQAIKALVLELDRDLRDGGRA